MKRYFPDFLSKVFFSLFLLCIFLPSHTSAYTEIGRIDGVAYTLYGPTWIWRSNEVNALFVLQNYVQIEKSIFLEFHLTQKAEEGFEYSGAITQGVSLLPGQEKRAAFVGIRARDDCPLGVYPLEISLRVGTGTVEIEYPVEIIRGPVVAKGLLPLILPVGVALLWCFVVGHVIPRYGAPGAWKKPSEPYARNGGDESDG